MNSEVIPMIQEIGSYTVSHSKDKIISFLMQRLTNQQKIIDMKAKAGYVSYGVHQKGRFDDLGNELPSGISFIKTKKRSYRARKTYNGIMKEQYCKYLESAKNI